MLIVRDPHHIDDPGHDDFGGLHLFVVRESQWQDSKGVDPPSPVTSDGLYAWGAAPFGYNPSPELTVAEVGPGFKNTQYFTGGPERNCFDVDREGGTRPVQHGRLILERHGAPGCCRRQAWRVRKSS